MKFFGQNKVKVADENAGNVGTEGNVGNEGNARPTQEQNLHLSLVPESDSHSLHAGMPGPTEEELNLYDEHHKEHKRFPLEEFLSTALKATYQLSLTDFVTKTIILGLISATLFLASCLLLASFLQIFNGITPLLELNLASSREFLALIDQGLSGKYSTMINTMTITIALILTVSMLFLLEKYLDENWGVLKNKSTLERFSNYWMILSLIPAPFFLSIIATAVLKIKFSDLSPLYWVGIILAQNLISLLSFASVYKLLSKGILSWKTTLIVAAWAAPCFELVKNISLQLILSYLETPLVPGTLLFLMTILLWFCLEGAIFLFFGRVGYIFEFQGVFNHDAWMMPQGHFQRPMREIALICLLKITHKFYSGVERHDSMNIGIDPNELADIAFISPMRARIVLRHMYDVGLVEILSDDFREVAILKTSPEKLTLAEFIARLEDRKKSEGIEFHEHLHYASNLWFWREYSDSLDRAFSSLSLKDLYEKRDIQVKEKK